MRSVMVCSSGCDLGDLEIDAVKRCLQHVHALDDDLHELLMQLGDVAVDLLDRRLQRADRADEDAGALVDGGQTALPTPLPISGDKH